MPKVSGAIGTIVTAVSNSLGLINS